MAEANRPRDFLLSEGEGWRLGYDRDPVSSTAFTALVGSDTWSVTMTKHEFTDFIQVGCRGSPDAEVWIYLGLP